MKNDMFDSIYGGKSFDGWMAGVKEDAEKIRAEKEITELVEKNPEYIHKCGVIDEMTKTLMDKITELKNMKVQIKCDIANRIIAASGDKYKGYMFQVPPSSSTVFGRNTEPIVKKEENDE